MRKLFRLTAQKGSGLVEMLLVSLLVGSAGMVVIAMPLYFTGSSVRSDQYLKRSNTIESTFGFGMSRLAGSNSNDIGMGERVAYEAAQSYRQTVIEDQPVGYWGLNEKTTATTVKNGSIYPRHGSAPPDHMDLKYVGAVTKAQPSLLPRYADRPRSGNRSVEFNGTSGKIVNKAHPALFNFSGDHPNPTFTLEAWADINMDGKSQTVFSYGPDSYAMAIMPINGSDTLVLIINDQSVVALGHMPSGIHHIVITHLDGTARSYLDGELLASSSVPNIVAPPDNGQFAIGAWSAGPTASYWPMAGRVDEVAIYDSALSSNRVSAHYEAGQVVPLAEGGGVKPVSLAGDQLVFKRNHVCYRMFYLADTREMNLASYNPAATGETEAEKQLCNSIRAVRGPSQEAPEDIQPTDSLYDPVLDNPGSSAFTISTIGRNIYPPDDGQPIISFLNPDGETIDTDLAADSFTSNPVYSADISTDYIDAIDINLKVAGTETDSELMTDIPATSFRQRYPLTLNCPRV